MPLSTTPRRSYAHSRPTPTRSEHVYTWCKLIEFIFGPARSAKIFGSDQRLNIVMYLTQISRRCRRHFCSPHRKMWVMISKKYRVVEDDGIKNKRRSRLCRS